MTNSTKPSHLATLAVLAGAATLAAADAPPPLFGDWFYLMPENWRDPAFSGNEDRCNGVWESVIYDDEATYLPVNHPSGAHGGPGYEGGNWLSDYAICVAENLDLMEAPVAILIRNRNCPFPYGPGEEHYDALAVENALNNLPKLDYLLMDLEFSGTDGGELLRRNVKEIHRLIRSHPNPRIRNARIGNYNDWPGDSDAAMIWPTKRDRKSVTQSGADGWDRDAFYNDYLDVAMPIAYPSEAFSRHSDASVQGDNTTPNDRAAIFWGPLERVSVAARNLPDGHMLVPWITNYLQQNGGAEFYHAPPPSAEDLRALVQHYRLRGARSFMVWAGDAQFTHHPEINLQEFRDLAMDSWTELDPVFQITEAYEFLNLKTDKQSGVQWSGLRTDSTAVILVSNLNNEPMSVDLPPMEGLPDTTPLVAPGEHDVFVYDLVPAARDFDNDGDIDTGDFIAFVRSLQSNGSTESGTVGGKGVSPIDIDTNGAVDLNDIVAVLGALRDGRYSPAPRSNNRGRSQASAPTRGNVVGTK